MFGKSYLVEHCAAEYVQYEQRRSFLNYNSELLRMLNNSMARAFGGSVVEKSYNDMLHYKPEKRSAAQIKNHVLSKLKALGDS